MNLSTNEIRERFLNFFKENRHFILKSASLVTPDERGVTDSTLFNTAGVQPLIPFLLGEKHPEGKRLASSQKCIRTVDINEVGDKTHLTFFEMLGNWSLGDYFKEEAIEWSYQFLTDKEKGLGLDPNRIYITVFAGNNTAKKDDEAFDVWKKYIPEERIYFLESNWWEAGDNGPCGPDTEMFYDLTEKGLGDLTHDKFIEADEKQKVVEIWNNVFMQFEKKNGQIVGKLPQHAVDTGAGLERLAIVVNGLDNVYQTDNFSNIISEIELKSSSFNLNEARIITDHVKAATFIISDGIEPSNTDRGYVLRRLIRTAVTKAKNIDLNIEFLLKIPELVYESYGKIYDLNLEKIKETLENEIGQFNNVYEKALKELSKQYEKSLFIDGEMIFNLESTNGLPKDLVLILSKERNYNLKKDALEVYSKLKKEHQEKSRTSAAGKFKGGLKSCGNSEIKYHTATHLLQQALINVLGNHVEQKGSNINSDRLRFDFTHPEKLTEEQKKTVENIVNEKIKLNLPVKKIELAKDDAMKTGAIQLFSKKYGDVVSIYYIGENLDSAYSKEFCGGPHVKNTGALGSFRIKKEEAVSAGVRRIKAILE